MKKIFNLILLILLFTNSYSQQNASLLYNWQDSSLVGSWAYDNIYNECWGVYINDHEIAIIGSTAGTHFFDITDPENAYEIDFVQGGIREVVLSTEIITITMDIYMQYVMKEIPQLFKLLIFPTYQILLT